MFNGRSKMLALVVVLVSLATTGRAAVEQVLTGLDQPVRLVAPAGDARLFVAERPGKIRVFNQQGGGLGTFLDIGAQTTNEGERGMTGLAFAPDYATSGRFYVTFTDLQGDLKLARYSVSAGNSNLADAGSQEILLTVDMPGQDHIAGHIEFALDGTLYMSLGDGEYGGDPGNRAQDPQQLLGKILRLDVGGATGYTVPADNPFVGEAPRDEIWSLGLRNPWCFAFDRLTGDLYIADVGENVHEEIDIQPAASGGRENYGWRLMAGPQCFIPNSGCRPDTLSAPVHSYTHAGGSSWRCAVVGGYVYRGARIPSLRGEYFFADYCSREIWSLKWTAAGGLAGMVDRTGEMTPSGGYIAISSFGQDGLGELYVLDHAAGKAFRIVNAASSVPVAAAAPRLAQNQPNPFNPATEIAFTVGAADGATRLEVYDTAGRRVRGLVLDLLTAGDHTVVWDGTDDNGRRVPSGVYLYRLENGGAVVSRKMLLVE